MDRIILFGWMDDEEWAADATSEDGALRLDGGVPERACLLLEEVIARSRAAGRPRPTPPAAPAAWSAGPGSTESAP